MRAADILCRCCGQRYNQLEDGCVICMEAKNNIIWPEEDLPYLPSLMQQAVRLIELNLSRLEKDMKASLNGLPYEKHVKAAKDLTAGLVALSGEVRKLEAVNSATAKQLTAEKKINLVVEYLDGLAPEHKELAMKRIKTRLLNAAK